MATSTTHCDYINTSNINNNEISQHKIQGHVTETIKRRSYEIKRQFHNGRFVILKNLPKDITEKEIRNLLKGYLVHSVQIHMSNGSARVLLADPDVLETWPDNCTYNYRNQNISAVPSPTEGVLCVARMPLTYSEPEFIAMVSSLGEVVQAFLMKSDKTGENKGYGFVEYSNKDIALQAKAFLDKRELSDCVLHCDWLDPSHVTFRSLHSSCLYVDRLPKNYRDLNDFRKTFSTITNPPYCQIAMKNGALQDWGLVEYLTPEDAEETFLAVNGHMIQGQPIRVQYCIPGARAINIYMEMLSDTGVKKKTALMPEPPSNRVFSQLQNLTKQNPAFVSSLQNIILTQIQNVQNGSMAAVTNSTSPGAPPDLSQNTANRTNIHPNFSMPPPNFSGSAPPPLTQILPNTLLPNSSNILGFPGQPQTSAMLSQHNPNAQAALVLLLAAQLQQRTGENPDPAANTEMLNGLLANPQVISLLQSIVPNQQAGSSPSSTNDSARSGGEGSNVVSSTTNGSGNPKSTSSSNYKSSGPPATSNSKNALLPTPNSPVPQWQEDSQTPQPENHDAAKSLNLMNLVQPPTPTPLYPQPPLMPLAPQPTHLHPQTAFLGPQTPQIPPHQLFTPPPTPHPNPLLFLRPTDPDFRLVQNSPLDPNSQPQLIFNPQTAWGVTQPMPRMMTPIFLAASPPQPQFAGCSTPIGNKRKLSRIPPSPEPSPQGGYIGQHSQGLGGHYQDSYYAKKMKKY